MESRVIFHVDVNSAFLSWEAVERLKNGDTVDLREIPSAVGGDVDRRHGIITAKSIPAKKAGVITGEPVVKALQKCPNLVLVPSSYGLYERCSRAFMDICREYASALEPFSVDECFLDVTAILPKGDRPAAVRLADEIRNRIHEELGFTVNIGISENKLLAKMASDFQKPDRTHTLWPDEIETKMWPLPAGDLLFCGKAQVERLKILGVTTIGDIAALPLSVLTAHVGEKGGAMLYNSSRGLDRSPVQESTEDEKSYSHSFTVPVDLTDFEDVRPVLLHLTEMVCRRMRRDGVRAGLVTVSYKSNEFKTVSRQRKLDYYTYASDPVFREVVALFTELWDKKTPIRLLGVALGNLKRGDEGQINFLMEEELQKRENLELMLDSIRQKFGNDAVKRLGDIEK